MSSSEPLTLGVDLGGTKVMTALVDFSGKIVDFKRRPANPEQGAAAVIADIIARVIAYRCAEVCNRGRDHARMARLRG